MKKVLIVFMTCFVFTSLDAANAEIIAEADCFEIAFQDLDDLEHDLGFYISIKHATELVNDFYAVCECTYNGHCDALWLM